MSDASLTAPSPQPPQPRFTLGKLKSPTGDLVLYSAQPWHGPSRPVVVILHGALRSGMVLSHWADRLKDLADVVLVDLPGHGRSDPLLTPTIDAMATKILDALRIGLAGRQILVVGESLGGLVALAIAGMEGSGDVKAVFAADPPITTKKLLNVTANLTSFIARNPGNPFANLAFHVFGIKGEDVEERIYYPVLGALRAPAMIATGDYAMFPIRQRPGLTQCLFDAVDRFVAREFYGDRVEVREIENAGHLLMIDHVEPCLAMIKELLSKHFTVASVAPAP